MSRDLGYTPPPINIIKNNYPKKTRLSFETAHLRSFTIEERVCKTEFENSKQKGAPGGLRVPGSDQNGSKSTYSIMAI